MSGPCPYTFDLSTAYFSAYFSGDHSAMLCFSVTVSLLMMTIFFGFLFCSVMLYVCVYVTLNFYRVYSFYYNG